MRSPVLRVKRARLGNGLGNGGRLGNGLGNGGRLGNGLGNGGRLGNDLTGQSEAGYHALVTRIRPGTEPQALPVTLRLMSCPATVNVRTQEAVNVRTQEALIWS